MLEQAQGNGPNRTVEAFAPPSDVVFAAQLVALPAIHVCASLAYQTGSLSGGQGQQRRSERSVAPPGIQTAGAFPLANQSSLVSWRGTS